MRFEIVIELLQKEVEGKLKALFYYKNVTKEVQESVFTKVDKINEAIEYLKAAE